MFFFFLLLQPESTVSINPSPYFVLPDLFLSLYMSLWSCLCSSSSSSFNRTVSINPSRNRVVPDLFVSLYVPFRSCFSSCFSSSSWLLVLLPVRVLLLRIVELVGNGFERTSLASRSFKHMYPSLFYRSVLLQCIHYSTTCSFATDLCIRTDLDLGSSSKAYVLVLPNQIIPSTDN